VGKPGSSASTTEAATGQRFTVLHEFKQLVDHGRAGNLYIGNRRKTTDDQAEQGAYYFAACTLMPKRLCLPAWG
jgi:Zn-dependent peptidase ImmA (M78 family)